MVQQRKDISRRVPFRLAAWLDHIRVRAFFNSLKKVGNRLAVIGIVAVAVLCWVVLLFVMPLVPDLDVRAGCKRKRT